MWRTWKHLMTRKPRESDKGVDIPGCRCWIGKEKGWWRWQLWDLEGRKLGTGCACRFADAQRDAEQLAGRLAARRTRD